MSTVKTTSEGTSPRYNIQRSFSLQDNHSVASAIITQATKYLTLNKRAELDLLKIIVDANNWLNVIICWSIRFYLRIPVRLVFLCQQLVYHFQ